MIVWTRGYPSSVRGGAELSASEFGVTGTVFSNVFLHSFEASKWPRLDSSRAKWLRSDFEVTSRCGPEVTSHRVFRSDFEPRFPEPSDLEVTSRQVFLSCLDFDATWKWLQAECSRLLPSSKWRRAEFSQVFSTSKWLRAEFVSSVLDFEVASSEIYCAK